MVRMYHQTRTTASDLPATQPHHSFARGGAAPSKHTDMKANKRYFNQDVLSVEHNGRKIMIYTHRGKIVVQQWDFKKHDLEDRYYTFDEFYHLLEHIEE